MHDKLFNLYASYVQFQIWHIFEKFVDQSFPDGDEISRFLRSLGYSFFQLPQKRESSQSGTNRDLGKEGNETPHFLAKFGILIFSTKSEIWEKMVKEAK